MSETLIFHRGETALPTLEALAGDPSVVDAITAKMRLSFAPRTTVAVQLIERVDAPPGWDMLLDESVSAGLQLGVWQLDARLEIGSSVVVTDPLAILVVDSASGG